MQRKTPAFMVKENRPTLLKLLACYILEWNFMVAWSAISLTYFMRIVCISNPVLFSQFVANGQIMC